MKIGLKLTKLDPPKMSPAPSSHLTPYYLGHSQRLDDVHDRLALRLEGRRELYRNLAPFLYLRVQEALEKEGLDCEAHLFLRNDLVSWDRIGF